MSSADSLQGIGFSRKEEGLRKQGEITHNGEEGEAILWHDILSEMSMSDLQEFMIFPFSIFFPGNYRSGK